ncbi:MAG TPA: ankyrin repeat domain-containing protein [Gammaproteobacteria bacterium]|nr:ankyrin repeat domain-containing protein [Gammaproteobacteria bacterium]
MASDTMVRPMLRRRLRIADALSIAFFALAGSVALLSAARAASALVDAAGDGEAAAVIALLADGADPNARSEDGTSALHWAAYHDDVELARALVAAGATADVINEYGSTPLSEAAAIGNPRMIALLLDAGADVDRANADGQTPLMIVARTSKVEAAKLLIDAGADVNRAERWRGQTPLMWAAAQGQPGMIRLLLESGAEPDVRSAANEWPRQVSGEPRRMYRPTGGLSPLLFAAREGCTECVAALLEGGANPDFANPDNVTALFIAIDNGHMDAARVLIEAGANVNKWDWWGRTPLFAAVDQNAIPSGGRADRRSADAMLPIEVIGLLLEAGANPDLQLKMSTPYRSIVDDRGCDSMLKTGMTPLLLAAKTFDAEAMRPLLESGANFDLPNQDGIRPIHAAAGLGSSSCDPRGYGSGIPHYETADVEDASIAALRVLIEAGADVNAQAPVVSAVGGGGRFGGSRTGQTALHGAVTWGWNDVVRFLVDQGARIDIADAGGRTPYDTAVGGGQRGRGDSDGAQSETAALLLELCAGQAGCDVETPATPRDDLLGGRGPQ